MGRYKSVSHSMVLCFSALLSIVSSSSGYAQDQTARPATEEHAVSSESEKPRELFEKGINAFDKGDYNQALQFFLQSLALTSACEHPEIPHNIAVTLRKLGRNDDALAYDSITCGKKEQVQEQLQPSEDCSSRATLLRALYHPGSDGWYLWPIKYFLYLLGIFLLFISGAVVDDSGLAGGLLALLFGLACVVGGLFI